MVLVSMMQSLFAYVSAALSREEGQDFVEYACSERFAPTFAIE